MNLQFSRVILSGALLMAWAVPSMGAVMVIPDRVTFNGLAPGLPVEDFEEAMVGAFGIATFDGPLNSTSNNAVFAPGDILPGIEFVNVDAGQDMVVLGSGVIGNPSKVVGPNVFADDLDILFAPAVTAVAFDLFGNGRFDVTVTLFDTSNSMIDSFVFNTGTSAFAGFISSTPIGRIRTSAGGNVGEVVDNVAFGNAGSAVPEPGTYAMIAGGLLGLTILRRRKV